MVGLGLATPGNLLLFTFLIGAAGALTIPAWQAVVPQLVPKEDLPPAIAANSVGVNISRAIGPALGGVTIAAIGIAAPFWINAISNLGIVGALLWWRRTRTVAHAASGRAFRPGDDGRSSLRPAQSASARDLGARGGIFSVRQRLLGAAAAGRAFPDRQRTGVLRHPARRHRRRRRERRVPAAVAEGEARAGPGHGVGRARPGGGDGALRRCPRARDCARSERAGRGDVDRVARDVERIGAGGVAGLGPRPRARALHHGVFRLPDARQRGLGRGRRLGRIADRALSRRRRRASPPSR